MRNEHEGYALEGQAYIHDVYSSTSLGSYTITRITNHDMSLATALPRQTAVVVNKWLVYIPVTLGTDRGTG